MQRDDSDAGKDWRQEEKGMTEDEVKTLEAGDGQGGLACCSPLGCRVGHDWATELSKDISNVHCKENRILRLSLEKTFYKGTKKKQ